MSPIPFPVPSAIRCEAATPAIDAADHAHDACEAAGDPATLIGLALSFVRQGPLLAGEVPPLILDRLAIHARHGNPACSLVLNWLGKRSAMAAAAETAVLAGDAGSESRLESVPIRRRTQRDRVTSAMAATALPDPALDPAKPQRGLRRKRREPLVAIVSATTAVSDKETSHG